MVVMDFKFCMRDYDVVFRGITQINLHNTRILSEITVAILKYSSVCVLKPACCAY